MQHADLVSERPGATAAKTDKLIDAALGGVLLIDEASWLHNTDYAGGGALGQEAVRALLNRAEDDRDPLVIILAGVAATRVSPAAVSRVIPIRLTTSPYSFADVSALAVVLGADACASDAHDS